MIEARQRKRSAAILIVSLIVFIVVVAAVWVLSFGDAAGNILLLSTLLLGICGFPVVLALSRGSIDFLEPIYGWSAVYFLYFGGRAAYIASGSSGLDGSPNLLYSDLVAFTEPLALSIVGQLLFLVGYYSGIPRWLAGRLRPLSAEWNVERNATTFYVALGVGVVAFLVLTFVHGVFYGHVGFQDTATTSQSLAPGTFIGLMGQLKQLLFVSAVLGVVLYVSRTRKSLFLLVLLAILLVVIFINYFLLTAKQGILYTVLYVVIPLHYLKKRISFRGVLIFSLFTFVSFPLFYLFRQETGYSQRQTLSGGAVMEDLGEFGKSLSMAAPDFLEYASASVMNRFAGVDSVALAINVPEAPGDITDKYSSFLAFAMWIPRVLWSGKPKSADFQVWFGHEYWGIPPTIDVQIPPTLLGEILILLGRWGILAMFLYGLFSKFAYSYLIERGPSRIGVLLYPFVFIKILLVETTFGAGIVQLLYTAVMILLMSKWISGSIWTRRHDPLATVSFQSQRGR